MSTMWKLHRGHYIWPGRLPNQVVEHLGAQQVAAKGTFAAVLPATVQAYRAIREAGMQVPCITHAPDWRYAGQHTPLAHQRKKTIPSMLAHKRSFVLDDPGTGKTLSGIWAAQAMFERGGLQRLLIVAPKSIVDGVWRDEVFLHTEWPCADLTNRSRAVRRALAQDPRYKVLLINPQSLHSVVDVLAVDGVLVDEFTAFKTASSRQSKALAHIVEHNDPWLVMMSGTPAPQGPEDAYHPIKLVNPRARRLTMRYWKDMTMHKVSEFRWVPKHTAQDTLIEWLQPGSRTSRDEALDLPPCNTYTRRYSITQEQEKAIKQMRDAAVAEMDGGKITAANAAVAASKALQILTGDVRYVDEATGETRTAQLDASTWVEAVQEVVEERHHPVLIFVPFRLAARKLAEALKVPCIMGDTKPDERRTVYQQINRGEVRAVVAVAATMSHGLTLTGSNCVLWALPPTSAEQYLQANARVFRKGQQRPVDIIHLVGHNFVQALFTRRDGQVKLQQAVLDALAAI